MLCMLRTQYRTFASTLHEKKSMNASGEEKQEQQQTTQLQQTATTTTKTTIELTEAVGVARLCAVAIFQQIRISWTRGRAWRACTVR